MITPSRSAVSSEMSIGDPKICRARTFVTGYVYGTVGRAGKKISGPKHHNGRYLQKQRSTIVTSDGAAGDRDE